MTKKRWYFCFAMSFILFAISASATVASFEFIMPWSDGSAEREYAVYRAAQNIFYDLINNFNENDGLDTYLKEHLSAEHTNIDFQFLVNDEVIFYNNEISASNPDRLQEDYQFEDDVIQKFTLIYRLRGVTVDDAVAQAYERIDFILEYREIVYTLTVVFGLAFIFTLLKSLKYIGVDDQGVAHLTILDRIPIEIYIFGLILGYGLVVYHSTMELMILFALVCVFVLRSFIVRKNGKVLYHYSLLRLLSDIIQYSVNNSIGLWIAGGSGLLLTFVLVGSAGFGGFILSVVYWLILILVTWCWIQHSHELKSIRALTNQIRGGHYSSSFPKFRHKDLQAIGDNLTGIQAGLQTAVNKQLQSERTKSELITNVSHDLKTPLTSIVNYVDLLKHEAATETQTEYLTVLDKQVSRLRKLTDDLFEAAKINTQDVKIETKPMNLKTFWEQCVAEYDDKVDDKKLQLITKLDDVDCDIMADGQYLWRVIDNLLRNLVLYALDGTRVYIDGDLREHTACLSLKNISKDALNVSETELMERFVRGDSSRSTEGSGLGLSICRSIVELMGGQFGIHIDGDLFKVEICLPLASS